MSCRKPDFFYDVLHTADLCEKIGTDRQYAQQFYAGLCNNVFHKKGEDTVFSCSWRTAGELVAQVLGAGDYLDWYGSGYIPGATAEGTITTDVQADLEKMGWEVWTETVNGSEAEQQR